MTEKNSFIPLTEGGCVIKLVFQHHWRGYQIRWSICPWQVYKYQWQRKIVLYHLLTYGVGGVLKLVFQMKNSVVTIDQCRFHRQVNSLTTNSPTGQISDEFADLVDWLTSNKNLVICQTDLPYKSSKGHRKVRMSCKARQTLSQLGWKCLRKVRMSFKAAWKG